MNTVRAGTGPGLGYESMYIVFVFKNEMALKQFIGAKGGGGDIGASATLGIIGEQISFNPEIGVYQFYRNGFDLQANWGGTLYMPAMSLND
jgi:lipid-binding SYLF domain-containing protein